ncbi:R3H domain-containing protein 1 [Halotydeus destructor]|nr:R3H domain-containing protein 1 [Halotydeus destructor]
MKNQETTTIINNGDSDEVSLSKGTESSTEQYTDHTGTDLRQFMIEILQTKDRTFLLRIEKELTALVRDSERTTYKFQPMPNPYYRMLVHRAAAFFGFDHNVDRASDCVVVIKTRNTRLPDLKFEDVALVVTEPVVTAPEPKKLLKREMAFDNGQDKDRSPDRPGNLSDYKSKSFEEREVMYAKVRERIFNQQDSLSSTDGGETSAGNTASPECSGRSPINGTMPTANSSLDDVRPWSSVDSDGYTRPKLGREFKRSFELDSRKCPSSGSAVTSPNGGMSYLKPSGYATSSSATELAEREKHKLDRKSSSFGGISKSHMLRRENSMYTAADSHSNPKLKEKANSLNLPNNSNGGGDHAYLRRGGSSTIYENTQSNSPLLANPTGPKVTSSGYRQHQWSHPRDNNGRQRNNIYRHHSEDGNQYASNQQHLVPNLHKPDQGQHHPQIYFPVPAGYMQGDHNPAGQRNQPQHIYYAVPAQPYGSVKASDQQKSSANSTFPLQPVPGIASHGNPSSGHMNYVPSHASQPVPRMGHQPEIRYYYPAHQPGMIVLGGPSQSVPNHRVANPSHQYNTATTMQGPATMAPNMQPHPIPAPVQLPFGPPGQGNPQGGLLPVPYTYGPPMQISQVSNNHQFSQPYPVQVGQNVAMGMPMGCVPSQAGATAYLPVNNQQMQTIFKASPSPPSIASSGNMQQASTAGGGMVTTAQMNGPSGQYLGPYQLIPQAMPPSAVSSSHSASMLLSAFAAMQAPSQGAINSSSALNCHPQSQMHQSANRR